MTTINPTLTEANAMEAIRRARAAGRPFDVREYVDPSLNSEERAEVEAALMDDRLWKDDENDLGHDGAAYARAWKRYKKSRARLMHLIVSEPGAVSNEYNAYGSLTDREYGELLLSRGAEAQERWADFQDAERAYVLAVDGNVPVKFRKP